MSQAEEEEAVLSAAEEHELLEVLEAALRPAQLDPELNERLIEMALEDPLAPASDEELAESAWLRDALQTGSAHEDAELLATLRVAAEPSLDEAAVEHAVQGALQRGRGAEGPRGRGRGNVIYAVFGGAGALLAAAAAIVLFVGTAQREAPAPAAELAKPRSTAPLFSDRFETGDTTARMDLIASQRSRDLRDNRYASWGVK